MPASALGGAVSAARGFLHRLLQHVGRRRRRRVPCSASVLAITWSSTLAGPALASASASAARRSAAASTFFTPMWLSATPDAASLSESPAASALWRASASSPESPSVRGSDQRAVLAAPQTCA